MKTQHDQLCILFGLLLTIAFAWVGGSENEAWSSTRWIVAVIFGFGASYSLIKRLTPISHGAAYWLYLPLLLCLVGMSIKEGIPIRMAMTGFGSFAGFMIIHRIATIRSEEQSSSESEASTSA